MMCVAVEQEEETDTDTPRAKTRAVDVSPWGLAVGSDDLLKWVEHPRKQAATDRGHLPCRTH